MSQILLSPAQVRAALSLLDWSNQKLAEVSGLYVDTIAKLCRGESKSHNKTIDLIKKILEREGIEFLDKDGVRRRSQDVEIFEGPDRFEEFYVYMYDHLEQFGGDVCLSVVDERLFAKYRTAENFEKHKQRMKSLVDSGRTTFRVLATESNHFKNALYAKYRWQSAQSSAPTAFYAFGNCLALLTFDHDPSPYVIIIKSGPLAEAFRTSFETVWKNAHLSKPEPSTT